jgi:hypothetical protein
MNIYAQKIIHFKINNYTNHEENIIIINNKMMENNIPVVFLYNLNNSLY